MPTPNPKPAFFLDRDGVLIEEIGYISQAEDVVLLPDVARALRMIDEAGFRCCVITNQAGVARGKFHLEAIHEVNLKIFDLLAQDEVMLRDFFACPHHPQGTVAPWNSQCAFRKPNPGLLDMAASELNISLAESFMIGDKISDLQAGAVVGCRTALVLTGHGPDHERTVRENAESLTLVTIATSFIAAVEACLELATTDSASLQDRPDITSPRTFTCSGVCFDGRSLVPRSTSDKRGI